MRENINGISEKIGYDTVIYMGSYNVHITLGISNEYVSDINSVWGFNLLEDLPDQISQKIDMQNYGAEIGNFSFSIINKNLSNNKMFSRFFYEKLNSITDNIYKKKVQIKRVKFDNNENYVSSLVIYTGYIDEITNDEYETSYSVSISDTQFILTKSTLDTVKYNNISYSVFSPKIYEEISNNLDLYTRERYYTITSVNNVQAGRFYRIDSISGTDYTTMGALSNEIGTIFRSNGTKNGNGIVRKDLFVKYARRKKEDSDNILICGTLTDNTEYVETLSNSEVVGWANADKEFEYRIIYSGLPYLLIIDLIYQTGITDSINYYDVISHNYNKYISNIYYEFGESIKNTFDFLKEDLFKLLNCYPIISSSGFIKLKTFSQPKNSDLPNIKVIDKTNTIELVSNYNDLKNIINSTNISINYDYMEDKFIETYLFFNEKSINKFGIKPSDFMSIEFKCINKHANISIKTWEEFIQKLSDNIFFRNSSDVKVLRFKVTRSSDIKVGDWCVIENDNIINWKGTLQGFRGIVNDLNDTDTKIDVTQIYNYAPISANLSSEGKRYLRLCLDSISRRFEDSDGVFVIDMINTSSYDNAVSIQTNHAEIYDLLPY